MTTNDLFYHIDTILDNAQTLLEDGVSGLNDRQINFLTIIVDNTQLLNHLCVDFVGMNITHITVDQRHQLGNPLTPVLGYAELLCTGMLGTFTPRQSVNIKQVYLSALALRDIIEMLVQTARLQARA